MILWQMLLFVPLVLASPTVEVNWSSSVRDELAVRLLQEDAEFVERCVQRGMRARYHFEMKVCKHRSYWLDSCKPVRPAIHTIEFDTITQYYRLVRDYPGNPGHPDARRYRSFSRALSGLVALPDLSLGDLTQNDSSFANSRRAYLGVRVRSECRGEYNRAVVHLSALITFGLVRLSGFDTGWLEFWLRRKE